MNIEVKAKGLTELKSKVDAFKTHVIELEDELNSIYQACGDMKIELCDSCESTQSQSRMN